MKINLTHKGRRRSRWKKGFTLIEMLIVVAIIGILVAIAVPALNTAKAEAQQQKRNAIEAQVSMAKIRAFLANNIIGGSTAEFDEFKEYLLINGQIPTLEQVANKANNGAGLNIASWGEFPEGPDVVGITWHETNIVTE